MLAISGYATPPSEQQKNCNFFAMYVTVPLALLGSIPVILMAYWFLSPARAATLAFAFGTCFLPNAEFPVTGLPDFSKSMMLSLSSLLGILAFHPRLLSLFQPSIVDVAALSFCISPFASSLSNGLGIYDAVSSTLNATITWGIPYGVGRLMLNSAADVEQVTGAILACGLIYAPLCLWESVQGPHLHRLVYGFHAQDMDQAIRWGGWRPVVFMRHGLQASLWMCCCTIIGFSWVWLGRAKGMTLALHLVVVVLIAAAFLWMRSMGAYILASVGCAAVLLSQRLGVALPQVALMAAIAIFLPLRISGVLTGSDAVDWLRTNVSEKRAQSLEFRLDNESMLIEKAMQRPIFGWGGWGRNRVYNSQGEDLSVTDGLWIIELGTHGLVGLITLFSLLLSGSIAFVCASSRLAANLSKVQFAEAAGWSIAAILCAIDAIPNAMFVPVITLTTGGLVTLSMPGCCSANRTAVLVACDATYGRGTEEGWYSLDSQ